jgi:hypothetical protein
MNRKSKVLQWSAAGSLILAALAHSRVQEFHTEIGPGNWENIEYVNFSSTPIGGSPGWSTSTFPGTPSGMKYYTTWVYIASGSQCFEVETIDPSYSNKFPNYDTRIWMWYYPEYRPLDDDSGPNNYSKLRIYLNGKASVQLYIAGYSMYHNNIDFRVKTTRLNLGEADCTTNQALPWVKNLGTGGYIWSANVN